jgi:hypothetical protein
VGILIGKKKKKKIYLVGWKHWKARGLPKGGFGCGLAIKARKGKKKRQAGRFGLNTSNASSTSTSLCHTLQ